MLFPTLPGLEREQGGHRVEPTGTTRMLPALPNANIPAWKDGPQAAEWEILFPHGVICLSRSTLNGLPSPASKSFLWEFVLSTLP